MFFKNIAAWSKKKFIGVSILFEVLYFVLQALVPAIIICSKYNVFGKTEGFRNITGLGLVVVVCIGIYSIIAIKRQLKKIPQVTVLSQRIKFGIELAFDLLFIIPAVYTMFVLKENVQLAFNTFFTCAWFFVAAILVNDLFIKFLDAEWIIRNHAKLNKESKKREGVV